VVGIGSRNSEFGTAIRLNPGLTHVFGNGVSATFDATFEDCAVHAWASIGVVMLPHSNLLDDLDDLCLLGQGGRGIATDELIVCGASDFEGPAEHRDRPVIAVLVDELQPQ